jgi:hypothetical protein
MPNAEESKLIAAEPVSRVPLQQGWDRRPRYETQENGLFVGRDELVERLTGDFTARSSGTILISGVRGVGKTALVERALLKARNRLQNRYWQYLLRDLSSASPWTVDRFLLRAIDLKYPFDWESLPAAEFAAEAGKRAEDLAKPRSYWSDRLNLLTRRFRRLHEASRSQLLVLKFNASDISGALADPQPAPDPQKPLGKPRVSPEKLMRALIRKLYSTCHPSQPTSEARVLEWSLRDRQSREKFFSDC